jgi:hypothetical protein
VLDGVKEVFMENNGVWRPNVKWADLEVQWQKDEHDELINTIWIIVAWGGLFLGTLVLCFWPELF